MTSARRPRARVRARPKGSRRRIVRPPRRRVRRRPAPRRRSRPARSLLLLGVVAAGVAAFAVVVVVARGPVGQLENLVEETQAILAPAAPARSGGELLVPRGGTIDVEAVPAPPLVGLDRAAARALAVDAGLAVVFEDAFSESVERGVVISQIPPAGTAQAPDEPLRASVSLGRSRAPVPTVVGLSVEQARAEVETAGFQMVERPVFSEDVLAGVVVRQAPIAGTLASRQTVVALQVSRGVETVRVPPLVGRTENDARRSIEVAGLVVGEITYRERGSVPNGMVEAHAPAAGTSVPAGSQITLEVVRVGEATVPSVVGLAVDAAERVLLDHGLLIGSMSRLPTAGFERDTVVAQEPGPDAKVIRGFGVRLIVATPGPVVETTPTAASG